MIIYTALMTLSALFSATDATPLNTQWAETAFADRAALGQPGRIMVLYEDALSDTRYASASVGKPIRLGDRTYLHGIGINAHSVIRVIVPEGGKRFQADIGLDRNVDTTPASVRFRVETEGRVLYETDIIRPGAAPIAVEVPLEEAGEFDLIVDNGGDTRAFDQADWADARIMLEDGSELFLDELPREGNGTATWPFSFLYGGRSSCQLLPGWERRIETDSTEDRQRWRLIFTDPVTKLEVQAAITVYRESPGVDWTIYFTNKGDTDTPILEQVFALDAPFRCGPEETATFHSLRCTGAVDDWLPFSEPLPPGQRRDFAPTNGRSSVGACPFFNVQWDDGGVVAGIGWTGQWAATVENRDGTVALRAGMQNLHLILHPGETIRMPRILLMQWTGTDETRAYNQWRETMLRYIVPRVEGEPLVPPIAYLSPAFYELDNCTEVDALSHLDAMKDLGFECYWYDAYYGKDNFPTVGNYVLPVERGFNTTRFPNLLKPVAEAVHNAGMRFLLWFEPERICPGTLMALEHPEWVVLPESGWGMFNLAVPEARQYITDYMGNLIEEYGLSWVRIDNAVSYTPLWRQLDEAAGSDRMGMAEIRYVEGLYRWWDDMRMNHPNIAIDNCASGGGRIDLELCSRSIPLWRTDATITPLMNRDLHQAALQNQVMTAGLSRYVPFNVSGQMGADPYNFRSAFNAGISFCEDVRPNNYPRETLRNAIAEGKRIRKYYFGNQYALTDITTSPKDWCVLQYHRPAEGDGMIMAFRRHESPFTGFACDLHEIEDAAEYTVTLSSGFTPGPVRSITGAALRGMVLNIDESPGSLLLEYSIVPSYGREVNY
ncbi:MAG: Alpha-galactosidase [Candidatus Hydrogenedentes bacterium ADurb.Bin179]|nr:MAG: Alpha-galactosidase [Candidatus Hydrogenedentes bacterium ADurb.Bin179]